MDISLVFAQMINIVIQLMFITQEASGFLGDFCLHSVLSHNQKKRRLFAMVPKLYHG